ncbi:hypothetical protein BpHYR1_044161 [Brachionus plicatilis]|uniref:Uncharacterized protein n=1 Tax=Brachionus plicatilis TaxID=10195 RepID=A0A3M7T102_BRAPC|nr:hypothetical protein BpHYR1_044161 [Brachionus plicatilis]
MPFEHLEDWLRFKWIQQQNARTSFFFSIWLTNTCCVVCTNTQYCKTDEKQEEVQLGYEASFWLRKRYPIRLPKYCARTHSKC